MGTISKDGLSQTGDYGYLLLSLVTLVTGVLVGERGFRKK